MNLYVYVYVCMYVCIHVCMYICLLCNFLNFWLCRFFSPCLSTAHTSSMAIDELVCICAYIICIMLYVCTFNVYIYCSQFFSTFAGKESDIFLPLIFSWEEKFKTSVNILISCCMYVYLKCIYVIIVFIFYFFEDYLESLIWESFLWITLFITRGNLKFVP